MKIIRNKYFIGLTGIVISVVTVIYLFINYDISRSLALISKTSFTVIASMISVYLASFIFRTLRWRLMLNNIAEIKFPILLKSIFTGFACNNVLPARVGELIRMKHLNSYSQVSNTSVLSSIFIEKILDAVVLLFFLTTAVFLNKDLFTEKLSFNPQLLLIISILFLLSFFMFRSKILNFAKAFINKRGKQPGSILVKIHDAFGFVYNSKTFFKVLGLSVVIWLIEGSVFLIGISGLGVEKSLLSISLLTLCLLNFSILIPSSPGYIGVFQAAILFSLSIFGIDSSQSLAVSIIIHACQFLPVTIIGLPIAIYDLFLPWVKSKRP
jgi:uncharacterized protein (TIRG00374 family)